MSADFCEAEHKNAKAGCYGQPDHTGKHWAYTSTVHDRTGERDNNNGNMIWEWGDEPTYTAPEGSVTLVLSQADIGVLLMTIQPVSHFFPDLQDKLSAAQAGIK